MNKFSQLLGRYSLPGVLPLAVCALLLSLIGILSIASVNRLNQAFPSREVLIQSVALAAGIFTAAFVIKKGYRYFTELDKYIYAAGILLLLSVYLPVIGTSFYGSRSWLDLGFVTFQPSEAAKPAFIIVMSSYLSKHASELSSPSGIIKAALYGSPFIITVAKEDFGSGCVFCVVWIFMVFCSGLKLKTLGKASLVFLSFLPLLYSLLAGYQKDRIDAFLSPDNLDLPGNYQVWNSKTAIGSGGFAGKGYMQGTQSSLGFLPVPESDFIFASAVEESGFVGGIAIIILFSVFIYSALRITKYASDPEGALAGAGLSGMFLFQAFENIAMNMGIMPVTGITLPFMSYGGSSMISSMICTGLLISIGLRQKL